MRAEATCESQLLSTAMYYKLSVGKFLSNVRNVVHHMYHKYRFCKPTYGKVITFAIVQQRIQTEWYKLRLKLGKDIKIIIISHIYSKHEIGLVTREAKWIVSHYASSGNN